MGWEEAEGTASASTKEKGWTERGTVMGYTDVTLLLTSLPRWMSNSSDVWKET